MKFESITMQQGWALLHPRGAQALREWFLTARSITAGECVRQLARETGYDLRVVCRAIRQINQMLIEGKPVVL